MRTFFLLLAALPFAACGEGEPQPPEVTFTYQPTAGADGRVQGTVHNATGRTRTVYLAFRCLGSDAEEPFSVVVEDAAAGVDELFSAPVACGPEPDAAFLSGATYDEAPWLPR